MQRLSDRLNDEQLIVAANADRLTALNKSFVDISAVLQRTMESSKLTMDRANRQLLPLVALTRPELDALAVEVSDTSKRFDAIDKEVKAIEKRFNEIEGTANMAGRNLLLVYFRIE